MLLAAGETPRRVREQLIMASEESHIRRSLDEIEAQIQSFKQLLQDPKSAEILEKNTHVAIQAACLAASLKSLHLSLDRPDCSSCETSAAMAPPLACPPMAATRRQTVSVRIDTRHSFKSKVLGKLRKNIEDLLKEFDAEVLGQG